MEKDQRNRLITRIYNISRALIMSIFLGSLLLWAATAEAAELLIDKPLGAYVN